MKTVRTFRRNAGLVGALAVLLLIGGLVGLAAPRPTQKTSAEHGALVSSATSSPSATGTPLSQHIKNNALTDTPTPIPPTPTDTPTDTPTPVPPTATPAPTWHTLVSYAGNTAETLPSFTTSDPWRLDWTCTPAPTGQPTEGWAFVATVDGADLAGGGDICTDQLPTSGTMPMCDYSPTACQGTHTYVVTAQENGTYPMCSWTVTIEVYS